MSMDLYVLKIVATSNFFAQTGWISQGIIQDGSHNFFRSQNYPNFWGLIKITGWPFGDWRYTWLWFCYWHEDTSVLCQKTFRVKFRPEKNPHSKSTPNEGVQPPHSSASVIICYLANAAALFWWTRSMAFDRHMALLGTVVVGDSGGGGGSGFFWLKQKSLFGQKRGISKKCSVNQLGSIWQLMKEMWEKS